MRWLTLLVFAGLHSGTVAQISLGRQVIASCAVNGGNNITMTSTAGEPVVGAVSADNLMLNAGFQQSDAPFLEVSFEVVYSDCWNGENATLNIIHEGCGEIETVEISDDAGLFYEVNALPGGWYNITLTTTGGCTFTGELAVPVPLLAPCDLEIYNLVTPNDDGKNDRWFIENIHRDEYRNNKVNIVNRWGQIVWEADNYDNETVFWEGRNQTGDVLPEGTYYYEITFEKEAFTGYLTLLP